MLLSRERVNKGTKRMNSLTLSPLENAGYAFFCFVFFFLWTENIFKLTTKLCFHVSSLFSKTKNYEPFCSSSFIRCKTLY